MKGFLIVIMLFITCLPAGLNAQNQLLDSLSGVRDRNLKHLLDFRFRGGSGEFERQLLANVEYTDRARRECVVGVVILSFSVTCDNELSDFRMRNPLGYGMNEVLRSFFEGTENHWNTCNDERYTRFEIPVLFTLEGTVTDAKGFFTVEGKNPGYRCRPDSYYMDRYERFMERGRTRKAIEMIDILIKRDPMNSTYTDLKRNLLSPAED